MKTLCLLSTLLLASCSLTAEQKAAIASNAAKDVNAALVGGLTTGTWAGAAAGAGAQFVRNHTAAKQPIGEVNP
jgi:hypothetical protein